MIIKFIVRPYKPSDLPFVWHTWMKSQRRANEWLEYDKYKELYGEYLNKIIPKAEILVAESALTPDAIIGYSAYIDGVLKQCYIKRKYRCDEVETALKGKK